MRALLFIVLMSSVSSTVFAAKKDGFFRQCGNLFDQFTRGFERDLDGFSKEIESTFKDLGQRIKDVMDHATVHTASSSSGSYTRRTVRVSQGPGNMDLMSAADAKFDANQVTLHADIIAAPLNEITRVHTPNFAYYPIRVLTHSRATLQTLKKEADRARATQTHAAQELANTLENVIRIVEDNLSMMPANRNIVVITQTLQDQTRSVEKHSLDWSLSHDELELRLTDKNQTTHFVMVDDLLDPSFRFAGDGIREVIILIPDTPKLLVFKDGELLHSK